MGRGSSAPAVVFCVIENDVAEISRLMPAGANEYLLKPFDRDSVEAKFRKAGLL